MENRALEFSIVHSCITAILRLSKSDPDSTLRPNRAEPRAIKRRPKNYPLLNKHRKLYKEIQHRNRYRKELS